MRNIRTTGWNFKGRAQDSDAFNFSWWARLPPDTRLPLHMCFTRKPFALALTARDNDYSFSNEYSTTIQLNHAL